MKYRKKPVVIDAIQWTGQNCKEISDFASNVWDVQPWKPFVIQTLEDEHTASVGDYIIRGVKGEFYPCQPDIFDMTYELAVDSV